MVTLEMLKGITTGAVRIWEEDGWFRFSRFTRYQEELLQQRGFAPREQAGAGMRLEFLTRGGRLAFDYEVHPGSGRDYWGIEIAHDGLGMVHLQGKVPHSGHVCHQIPPLEREIRVTVYFPNLAALRIRNLQLPEDAAPYTRQKKYLALGDSITQGYDAAHPNQTYVNLLADAWDAQVLNQAIGGDVFCPENLDPALDFSPDIITVAYGTNDWTLQVLQSGAAKAYLDKLTGLYPGVPVFVLIYSLFTSIVNRKLERSGLPTDNDVYRGMTHIDPETGEPVERDEELLREEKRSFRRGKGGKGGAWKNFIDNKMLHKKERKTKSGNENSSDDSV